MVSGKSGCPILQSWDMAHCVYEFHDHSVLVAFAEKVETAHAEEGHEEEQYTHQHIHRKNAHQPHYYICDDCCCPKTEVGKDVHHGKQHDGGGCPLCSHIRTQFHNLVWFASKQSDWSGIVEGKSCNGQFKQFPVTDGTWSAALQYHFPCPGVHHVESAPQE